ncbi:hypothetical protein HU200_029822 [Digitaria exilis]|uniref:Uncharacterized protein n=1 Tax=Digitaria exilis TaxID=1010633 RepID=A0A835C1T5_9POAL|nr:hypothetical protein HU200_029822 [Digitaria exilis]
MLQIQMRVVADQIHCLKSKGMLRWAVFKEEKANINRLIEAVNRTVLEYKDRRLEVGLFYLKPRQDVYDAEVRSHLFRMPLKEALKRRKLEMKKRKEVLASYYNNSHGDTKAYLSNTTIGAGYASFTLQKVLGKACTVRLMLHTVVSIVLGFIVIFF